MIHAYTAGAITPRYVFGSGALSPDFPRSWSHWRITQRHHGEMGTVIRDGTLSVKPESLSFWRLRSNITSIWYTYRWQNSEEICSTFRPFVERRHQKYTIQTGTVHSIPWALVFWIGAHEESKSRRAQPRPADIIRFRRADGSGCDSRQRHLLVVYQFSEAEPVNYARSFVHSKPMDVPAISDGIEPDFANPIKPPPATNAASTNDEFWSDCEDAQYNASLEIIE